MTAQSGGETVRQNGFPMRAGYDHKTKAPSSEERGFLLAEKPAEEQPPHCPFLVASNGVMRRTVTRRLARSGPSVWTFR